MSRPTDSRRPGDAGFSLIEVVVAIGIFAVLVVAVLPQLIVGIRSNDAARRSTQAKSIALAELERMRNLPFHVSPNAGNYIDVFDRYFHDLTAPTTTPACTAADGSLVAPATSARGYVAPGAPRCAWEPTGALYRQVRSGETDADLVGFAVVVDTQFLSDTTPPTPVTPPSGYNTQQVGRDAPAAAQIGVTVTVLPLDRGGRHPVTTYTRISRHYAALTRVRATVDVTALDVGTATRDAIPLTLASGLVKVAGSLTYATEVDAVLATASAGLGTGQQGAGASSSAGAPPSLTTAAVDQGSGALEASGCALACWGGTHLAPVSVLATGGLPNAGSPGAPLEATVKEPSAGGVALALGSGSGASYRTALDLANPLLRLDGAAVGSATSTTCTVQTTGTTVRVGASGWLRTTAPSDTTDPSRVETCGTARTSPIAVLPTSWAPNGVLRVQLVRASVRCTVTGTAHTATTAYDYAARVERWTPSGYVLVTTVTPTSSPTELGQTSLATTTVGTHGVLLDWIDSWSSVQPAEVLRVSAGGIASVTVPGVFNVLTQPLRNQVDADGTVVRDADDRPVPDPQSTLSLSLGSLGCSAQDAR